MSLTEYLEVEWRPSRGCTEPAAIALAVAAAAEQAGAAERVHLVCDPRVYKNCFAVGIPRSGGQTGILWAAALGAMVADPAAGLECFARVEGAHLEGATRLLAAARVTVEVDSSHGGLWIEARVRGEKGEGRAVIEADHGNLTRVECNGRIADHPRLPPAAGKGGVREALARLSFADLLALARSAGPEDRRRLREGAEWNLAVAEEGRKLLPRAFVELEGEDLRSRLSRMVAAGVMARMTGADLPVMTLAGSGNKGIVTAVPLYAWGRERGHAPEEAEEALALGCLVTSLVTHRLGPLSAMCGSAIAAGAGIAAGLVMYHGGDARALERAIHNTAGNLAGMICDGAKLGCGVKTMTGVDAAFRAATLALSGFAIPSSDGIVSGEAMVTLEHLGRLATEGMEGTDRVVLNIMERKLLASLPSAPAS